MQIDEHRLLKIGRCLTLLADISIYAVYVSKVRFIKMRKTFFVQI